MTDLDADPSVKVVVFQPRIPIFSSPISTYPRQLNSQRCWTFGVTLCCASARTSREHRQDLRPHARHR